MPATTRLTTTATAASPTRIDVAWAAASDERGGHEITVGFQPGEAKRLRVDGAGSEDTRMAAENQRSVRENTEALRDQARRVDATTPDDVNRTGPQDR